MKGKDIILYEAPSAQVFEVKTEGVICLSTRGYGWNEEENIVTLTLSVGFSENESTKALDIDYDKKTLEKYFSEGESIADLYGKDRGAQHHH